MTYNIDGNVLESPYSLLISIFLCLGVFNLGNFIQYFLIKKKFLIDFKKINYFLSPIIGTYFLILFLYYVVIFEFNSKLIINLTAYFLLFLSMLSFKELNKICHQIKNYLIKNNEFSVYLIILIFSLHFLIAASPITHADAIDYHFSGSLNILNFGHFQKEILPMNNNLTSLGDLIMSLGLAIKAEQFSNIIQFLSLVSLIPFFIDNKKKNIFLIFILICPITLILISSHKPQLLFCISSLLIFIFLCKYFTKLNSDDLKKLFPFFVIILTINSLAKYSFHLSAFLLLLYLFFLMSKKKLLGYSFFVSVLIFSFLYLPYLLFRYQYFDTGILDLLRSPLPINIYGYQSHHNLLGGGKLDIIGTFFPTNILSITTTYGPVTILLFLMINNKIFNYKKPILLVLLFFTFVFAFGSNLQRFLFEGFLWLVFLISVIFNYKSFKFKLFEKLVFFQLILMVPLYLFFVIKIFPGSLSQEYKKKVMLETANGYELSSWVNKKLNENDILLSSHRSISLFKNKTYSDIFTWHVDLSKKESQIYLEFLKSKKINRILFYKDDLKKNNYKNCIGKQLFHKKKAGKHIGRNPFRSSKYYPAWIYEFNYKQIPECIDN